MLPPDAPTPDSMPHDFIDAEIEVAGLETPTDEQTLNAALSALPGIQSLTIASGKVTVEYDPVQISKAKIGEAIGRAGYRVAGVESGPASSISDALHKSAE